MPLLCGTESCTLLPSIGLTPGRRIKCTEAEQVRLQGEDAITSVLSLNGLGNIVPSLCYLTLWRRGYQKNIDWASSKSEFQT